jgi:hypothetical protein
MAQSKPVAILWEDDLAGDYSLKSRWSYETGIYKNDHGQLVCDGLCPEESYEMLDSTGRIYKDSITAYYKIIDTTHRFHTIACDAWCYEFAGTDFITVVQKSKNRVYCQTECNPATHCSLILDIIGNKCFSKIELTSVAPRGSAVYYCANGYIKIDKKLWKQGIMKAEFNFIFDHKEKLQKTMYWKGKIYSKVSHG